MCQLISYKNICLIRHFRDFSTVGHEKGLKKACIVSRTWANTSLVRNWLKVFLKNCDVILKIPEGVSYMLKLNFIFLLVMMA